MCEKAVGHERCMGGAPGILLGVLTAALGFVLFANPSATATLTTFTLGWTLAIVGFSELVLALASMSPGRFPIRLLVGVLYGLTGIVIIASTSAESERLTWFIGLMLTVRGVVAGVVAFQVQGIPGWRWPLADAMASFVFGGLILVRLPASSDWALGTLVGVSLAVTGASRAFFIARLRDLSLARSEGRRSRPHPVPTNTTSRSKSMKVGIIGTGAIGGTLARKLRALGHQVRVANSRGPASLAALAMATDVRAVTVEEAVREAELVIICIPESRVPDLPRGLFDRVPEDVIIVDTGNYYPSWRDGRIEAIERGATESGWVASVIGRPVLKVFNSILAHSLAEGGRPRGARDRIALPIAGDDPRGKSTLIALLDELGFDAVDAGTLDESWRQQPGTPVYCTDLSSDGVRRALARADRASAPLVRELSIARRRLFPTNAPSQDWVQILRELEGAPS